VANLCIFHCISLHFSIAKYTSTEQQMKTIENTIQQLSSDIQTLSKDVIKIDEIVNVITSISEQTNLLALNAALKRHALGNMEKDLPLLPMKFANLLNKQITHQLK